jgi:hypothetical protein
LIPFCDVFIFKIFIGKKDEYQSDSNDGNENQAAASKPVDVIFLFSSETFEITSLVVSFVKVFCTESE